MVNSLLTQTSDSLCNKGSVLSAKFKDKVIFAVNHLANADWDFVLCLENSHICNTIGIQSINNAREVHVLHCN